MSYPLEIHEFFVEGKNREKSHVLLHITEPSPREVEKGYFFALCEIHGGSGEQIQHLEKMIDDLSSLYYETSDEPGKSAFEMSLDYINRRTPTLLENNTEIHCFIAVFRHSTISFTSYGQPQAYLFYRKQDVWSALSMTDTEGVSGGDRMFTSVAEGKISKGDILYITTPAVANHFSADRALKLIENRGVEQSAEHIQKNLEEFRHQGSFGGLILHNRAGREPLANTPITEIKEPARNQATLSDREKTTAETLSPSLRQNLSNVFSSLASRRQEHVEKKTTIRRDSYPKNSESNFRPRENNNDSLGNKILFILGRALVISSKALWSALKFFGIKIGRLFLHLFILITNHGGQRAVIKEEMLSSWYSKKNFIVGLPVFSKILFVLTLVFLLVFVGSISLTRVKEKKEEERVHRQELWQAVEDKQNAAEASLIYNDTNKALELLQEAQTLLTQIPEKTEEDMARSEELTRTISDTLHRLQKLTIVSPTLLSDLSQVQTGATPTALVEIEGQLIAFGGGDPYHYVLNPSTKEVRAVSHESISGIKAASVPKENDKIVFIDKGNQVAEYDKASLGITQKEISYPVDGVDIIDAVVYNRRLYALDRAKNQVYRHNQTASGYDRGTPWIKDTSIDFSQARGMSIDGDVYILMSNRIEKFVQGQKSEFEIKGLDPILEEASTLWTYADISNIYILEGKNRRLIVLNKEGKLLTQYQAAEWINPTGLVIADDGKKAYVLDQNKIYEFEMK